MLTPPEIHRLVKLLPASELSPRLVAGVWVILATGVRVGELLGAVRAILAAHATAISEHTRQDSAYFFTASAMRRSALAVRAIAIKGGGRGSAVATE